MPVNAPKKKAATIIWPTGGINRKAAYRQQPPFTTPDCSNVRPSGIQQDRVRGGTRPGCSKKYPEELGSGAPVRMLDQVDVVSSDGYSIWADTFQGSSLGSVWALASWLTEKPYIRDDGDPVVVASSDEGGVVRAALSDLDTSSPYFMELFVVPYLGQHWGSYKIYFRMDNSSPDIYTDGAVATLTIINATGDYSGTLRVYSSGAFVDYSFTGGSDGYPAAKRFHVTVNGDNVKCYWGSALLLNQNISSAAGSRFGFGLRPTVAFGVCQVSYFRIGYTSTNIVVEPRRFLVASAGGLVYTDTTPGSLTQMGATNLTLASDRSIQATQRLQKLYIADYGDSKVYETDGAIDVAGTALTSASVADWTTLGISTYDDVVEITNGDGNVTDGTYEISSVSSGQLTLSSSAGGSGNCTFRVLRGPKIYDPVADTLTLYTTESGKGSIPLGCPIIALYRDRIILAKEHLWWMSRQGNPRDFDLTVDSSDVQRAIAAQNSEAGRLGEPLRAVIPEKDDYVLFGCENSLWRLRGDPTFHGQLDNVSRNIGIVDKFAWCWGPSGEIIFLSKDGIYALAAIVDSTPESLSREVMPEELLNIDYKHFEVSMAYDIRDRGVHIYVTGKDDQGDSHWWFDWEQKSFWPVVLPNDHGPTATLSFKAWSTIDSAVLLGGKDGYVRRFHESYVSDDSTTISSFCKIGPIRMSGDDYFDAKLTEIFAVLSAQSGDIDFEIFTADEEESVVNATTAKTSGTWTSGLNRKTRSRDRGGALIIKLTNGDNYEPWTLEKIVAIFTRGGTQRVL